MFGVPQGTVLCPILFVMYVNSVLCMKKRGKIISFANDTVLTYEQNTWEEVIRAAENDFERINYWFMANELTVNLNETKYLPFGSYITDLPNSQSE